MDTEDLGPSPEEMGIDSNENLTGSSTSKETGQSSADQFENLIKKGGSFTRNNEVVGFEKEKLFVITKVEERDLYYREYFALERGQRKSEGDEIQNEDEEVTFQETAKVYIDGTQRISFSKKGRPTYHFDETEFLEFTNEFREYKTQFDLEYHLFDIKEDDPAIRPEDEGTSISVIYNPEGELFFVSLKHKDLPSRARFTSNYMGVDQDNVEAMEELRQAAKEGSTLEASGIKLGVAYSPDRENFIFTMYNKQGEEDFKVTVPLSVNVTEIMEETGALNILKNPTQPSEGIQGQGIGDTDWRHKSFSQLTGVKLTAAKL